MLGKMPGETGRHRAPGFISRRVGRASSNVLIGLVLGFVVADLAGLVLLAKLTTDPDTGVASAPPPPRSRPMSNKLNPVPSSPAPPASTGQGAGSTPGIDVLELGDLPWFRASNADGPAERNRSNGGGKGGDGLPLTINGTQYDKGIGVKAPSRIGIDLGRPCSRFTAAIGLDDEEDSEPGGANLNKGLVHFIVRADGRVVYRSPLVSTFDQAMRVDVKLSSARGLELVVDPVGTNANDHADWEAAKVECTSDPR